MNAKELESSLGEIAADFKKNVVIKDRKYRLKTYKSCFVGSEAVDYLVESGHALRRDDAVEIGKSLSIILGFEHVTRDHEFRDDYKFYRFVEEGERGSLSDIRWSDFLDPVNKRVEVGDDGQEILLPTFVSQVDLEAIDPKDQHVVSQVWPLDKLNTQLLDNVHPPSWQDPNPHKDDGTYSYDMVVIGAGAGGLVTAAGSAGVGARVALIEAHMLGGDCLNVGCVPSKAIIHSANLAHTLQDTEHLNEAGISLDPSAVKIDFKKVMERVRRIRSDISHHDSAERYSKELGVQIFFGRGKFTSENTIEVNGKTLTFKRAVIATGGYPSLIALEGLKELHEKATAIDGSVPRPIVMTNETLFNLTEQPKKMLVIGAGVIGMEIAQAMQRLGVAVTVVGRSGRILPKEDEDLSLIVKEQMIKDGIEFRLSVAEYLKIELTGQVLENGYPEMKLTFQEKGDQGATTTTLIFDAVLVAAGRRPNVTGMDLEVAKVEYDVKKGLIVDDKLQTTNPRVYGVGDCCSEFKFTHAADFMARAVIRNALFLGKEKISNLLIPYATFTSPEIASVGLYEKDLKEKGIEFRTVEKHFKDNDRAKCDSTTAGLVRFRVNAKTDTILGASIVGDGAGNMISEITLAMQSGTGLGALAAVIHPYPTTAESLRQSGDLYNKTRLTTTVKKLLRGIISLQR